MLSIALSLLFMSVTGHAQIAEPFYSFAGSERRVGFTHTLETEFTSLSQVDALGAADRADYINQSVRPLLKFLFGPLTHRRIGGPQRNDFVTIRWNEPRLAENGRVLLTFDYKATWIIEKSLAERGELTLPVPRSFRKLFTHEWQRCTDPSPGHATETLFWYYWDPARYGCDHIMGVQYDNVRVRIDDETPSPSTTFPEYERLFREENGHRVLKMTFAFGYVEDPVNPRPEKDADAGAAEYRAFLFMMGSRLPHLSARPIHLSEYRNATVSDRIIGYRFEGRVNGGSVDIEVLIAAGIDQIYLFAQSFAHRHDSVFAWMGHSRVGGGFDANMFRRILERDPAYYTITDEYQIVYWGGCNSYSYYTLPFFEFKAEAFPESDPKGTRGLDILAHGLPSYFSLNSSNAEILLAAMLGYPEGKSYQQLIRELENNGSESGARLLAVVLGDEDNVE